MNGHLPGLLPHHLAHLRTSGLADNTITAAGIYSETDPKKVAALLGRAKSFSTFAPAIVFPYKTATGANGYYRVRPDTGRRDRNDKAVKYESPVELPNQIYLPPGVADYLQNASQELLITEGEKKSLAATQEGFPCIGLVGVYGFVVRGHKRLIPDLEAIDWRGREVRIVFDSDLSTNPNVQTAEALLAKLLTDRGAKVRCVRLPDGPLGDDGQPTKIGLDDFIVSRGEIAKRELRKLLDNAEEPPPIDAAKLKEKAGTADPAIEAELFLKATSLEGVRRLRFWRGEFYWWHAGRYAALQPTEVRARLVTELNRHFCFVTTTPVNNIMEQLRAQAMLAGHVTAPIWLDEPPVSWKPTESIVAKNGIVHLPSLAVSAANYMHPATPQFFATTSLDYDFEFSAPEPERWREFLDELWGDDLESIAALQEWFGYCLTADTRLQKILLLLGPTRSGKGTIARVLRGVIGEQNCAGPTLSGLGTNFGLWSLLDKSLGIISDARLSGRTDSAIVVERLLSISGEDSLTIDRKYADPLRNVKLDARLMIISNELPHLGDSSGALAGRLIILRLGRSFYGRENITLTDELLAERPGILKWAIEGWHRLRARRHFIQPESSNDLREQVEDIGSPVGAFVKERCFLGTGHRESVANLFTAWKAWCEEKNREAGTEQRFGRDLIAAVPPLRCVRPRDGEVRWRGYEGISLKP